MLKIVADIHERPSRVPSLLGERGATVEIAHLLAGDYQLPRGALVERKTVRGMHAAIAAGTFWAQVGRLRAAARFPYVLVEGSRLDTGPLSPAAIRGACLALTDLGIVVLRSIDVHDSAFWLYRLAERRRAAPPRDRPPYAQRPKSRAGPLAAEAALAAVPGISTSSARALLAHFGSLAAVVAGEPDEWQRVSGIGSRRAKALAATIQSPYDASRSRRGRERQDPST